MRYQNIAILLLALSFSTSGVAKENSKKNSKVVKFQAGHKTVMPGKTLKLYSSFGERATIDGVPVSNTWKAPDHAGNHTLVVTDHNGNIKRRETVFVLEPSTKIDARGYLGNYRIGFYPKNTPKGFIKLEKDEVNLPVSKNFKIGQFLCKQQPAEWPKYVLVSDKNLQRLETLLAQLREDGRTNASTLFVMSGFRTPYYNTAIGSAKYSRHMYGDAADIYIDSMPRDGNMDDVNQDGTIDKDDANFIYDYAESLYAETGIIAGGLGAYKSNAVHGPFVHIDARGRVARWGR